MSYMFVVAGRKSSKFDVNTRGETGDIQRGPSVDLSWRQLQELLGMVGIGTSWIPMTYQEIDTLPGLFGEYAPNVIMAFKSAP